MWTRSTLAGQTTIPHSEVRPRISCRKEHGGEAHFCGRYQLKNYVSELNEKWLAEKGRMDLLSTQLDEKLRVVDETHPGRRSGK